MRVGDLISFDVAIPNDASICRSIYFGAPTTVLPACTSSPFTVRSWTLVANLQCQSAGDSVVWIHSELSAAFLFKFTFLSSLPLITVDWQLWLAICCHCALLTHGRFVTVSQSWNSSVQLAMLLSRIKSTIYWTFTGQFVIGVSTVGVTTPNDSTNGGMLNTVNDCNGYFNNKFYLQSFSTFINELDTSKIGGFAIYPSSITSTTTTITTATATTSTKTTGRTTTTTTRKEPVVGWTLSITFCKALAAELHIQDPDSSQEVSHTRRNGVTNRSVGCKAFSKNPFYLHSYGICFICSSTII